MTTIQDCPETAKPIQKRRTASRLPPGLIIGLTLACLLGILTWVGHGGSGVSHVTAVGQQGFSSSMYTGATRADLYAITQADSADDITSLLQMMGTGQETSLGPHTPVLVIGVDQPGGATCQVRVEGGTFTGRAVWGPCDLFTTT